METSTAATAIQLWGAGCFGLLIGWYVYYINRHRKGDVQLSDLVTLLGVLGGTAVLALFPARTDLFGAYGIGLAVGFFSYFLVLIVLVGVSKNFDADWFLDGRNRAPGAGMQIGPVPMNVGGGGGAGGSGGGGAVNP
jgi:hypothetical protein